MRWRGCCPRAPWWWRKPPTRGWAQQEVVGTCEQSRAAAAPKQARPHRKMHHANAPHTTPPHTLTHTHARTPNTLPFSAQKKYLRLERCKTSIKNKKFSSSFSLPAKFIERPVGARAARGPAAAFRARGPREPAVSWEAGAAGGPGPPAVRHHPASCEREVLPPGAVVVP